jgi:hypothetical protein
LNVPCGTTDGDHSRAGGDRPGRSLVRYAGQLGRAAEQQVTLPSVRPQRGFDDFALRTSVAAARCRIDDELERRREVDFREESGHGPRRVQVVSRVKRSANKNSMVNLMP